MFHDTVPQWFYMVPTIFFDPRFQDIRGFSRKFFKEFNDIFLQIPGQSGTHFIYLERLPGHSRTTTYLR